MSLDIVTAQAEALFASTLSAAEPHDRAVLDAVIAYTVRHEGGVRGCAAVVAYEYGEHPTEAASRMRWARDAVRPLSRRRGAAC